jgi:hypothetical protein
MTMDGVRAAACAVLALIVAGLPREAPTLEASASQQTATNDDKVRALSGAIDIHVHTSPDDRPRSLDAFEAARQARARGMRAIVLKNHYESTAGLAYLVRLVVPDIQIFGGIDLNLTVGGINPAAVEHMTRVSGGFGRVVWMPTFDAENQVRYSKEQRPFVSISRGGQLLPEVREVISIIAKHGLVLATGHSSPDEGLLLLREGRRQGVRQMVVTHAMLAPVLMDLPRMTEAVKLGAFIEFAGGSLATKDAPARLTRFTEAIRSLGPASCILSSDLGQVGNALPADGFGEFLVALRAKGFSDRELALMSKENPARLLGLP